MGKCTFFYNRCKIEDEYLSFLSSFLNKGNRYIVCIAYNRLSSARKVSQRDDEFLSKIILIA